jgi:hypothetical protein
MTPEIAEMGGRRQPRSAEEPLMLLDAWPRHAPQNR